ncbi:metallophosphoesterase family protein [Arenibaculum pallidiluteum]|uniref:metallophosphoesterase family protein n=1 Tax=Arenibaculum pallidiluteum TaxID=2812559 RepID=UPI001A9696F3|nr:metallophosphoesterase family protein [Arenibaculum pallidiluteum]
MRIALLADIHANREALEACLADARAQAVTGFAVLGDLVGYGADPGWVVDAVAELAAAGAPVVQGNHDEAAAAQEPDPRMRPEAAKAIRWTRERLGPARRAFLAGLPATVVLGEALLVHANAWEPGRWGYVTGPIDARRSIEANPLPYAFCGHVHIPALYDRRADGVVSTYRPVAGSGIPLPRQRRWLAVLGAVGQPRDGDPAASYAIFDAQARVLTYRRVPYDVDSAARKVLEAGLPASLARRLIEGR